MKLSKNQSEGHKYLQYLNKSWIQNMKKEKLVFREPILDFYLTEKVKLFCDSLEQDAHVFHMAIQIIEDFIVAQNKSKVRIKNPLLVVLCCVFLSGKQAGDMGNYKTGCLIKLYHELTHKWTTNEDMIHTEVAIVKGLLKFTKIPLWTQADDLKTLINYHLVESSNEKEAFAELALEIFNLYALHRREIFFQLRKSYSASKSTLNLFRRNFTNRFYIPCAIIKCTLNICDFLSNARAKGVSWKVVRATQLHSNDIELLAKCLYALYVRTKHKNNTKINSTF